MHVDAPLRIVLFFGETNCVRLHFLACGIERSKIQRAQLFCDDVETQESNIEYFHFHRHPRKKETAGIRGMTAKIVYL